jgi:hypothetical protein
MVQMMVDNSLLSMDKVGMKMVAMMMMTMTKLMCC